MEQKYLPVKWINNRLVYDQEGITNTVLYDRQETKESKDKIEKQCSVITAEKRINRLETI